MEKNRFRNNGYHTQQEEKSKKITINVKIDENLVKEFRGVVYNQSGLKRGDVTNAIIQAIIEYTAKYRISK